MKIEQYVTTRHISLELHKSLRTVQDWIRTGKLKADKLGRDYLIYAKDYEEFKNKYKLRAS